MFKFQRSFFYLSIATSVVLMLGFQNCSSTHFTSDLDGAVLKAEAIPEDSSTREEGDDGQTTSPIAVPSDGAPAVDDPSTSLPPTDDTNGGSVPQTAQNTPPNDGDVPKGGGSNASGQSEQAGDLVECQMLHPNKKVVLSYELKVQHSNASSVRVCMSQNACLNLINAFAVPHGCSLDQGTSATQDNGQAQCTEIFPGSKGTCKNASILSDEQISEILEKMAGTN